MVTAGSSVAPGLAPGGLYIKIITSTEETLVERALINLPASAGVADRDYAVTQSWLELHPDEQVLVMVFDGDTGQVCRALLAEGRAP